MIGLAMTIPSYFICIHVFVQLRWFRISVLDVPEVFSDTYVINHLAINNTHKGGFVAWHLYHCVSTPSVEVFIVQENKGTTIIQPLTLSPNSIMILFSIFQNVVCT